MASFITDIYDALRAEVFDVLPAGLGVNHIDLADRYRIGPELAAKITRLGPQKGLNALIVSPLESDWSSADATQRTKTVEQPFIIYFVYSRQQGRAHLRDTIDKYADPLHDILESTQLTRLGTLALRRNVGDRAIKVGDVKGFIVGEIDMDPPDNDDLYPDLACFTIPIQVNFVKLRDAQESIRSPR